MKENELDSLLKELGQRKTPPLPVDFDNGVWREIQRREEKTPREGLGWLADILTFALRPIPIAASLAVAMTVGFGDHWFLQPPLPEQNASKALSLQVFNPRTQGLTVLGER